MAGRQRIDRVRRNYNQWVASQTLEDYALRFTAKSARRVDFAVGNTAHRPHRLSRLEAIGGTHHPALRLPECRLGHRPFASLCSLIGLPIAYYAANYGVDIDLLTRGAGFGYMGSTVTSLIYASFTFLLFAIEASIMSVALNLCSASRCGSRTCSSLSSIIPLVTTASASSAGCRSSRSRSGWCCSSCRSLHRLRRHRTPSPRGRHFRGNAATAGGSQLRDVRLRPRCCCHCCRRSASRWTTCASCRRDRRTREPRGGPRSSAGPGWVLLGGLNYWSARSSPLGAAPGRPHVTQADEPTIMYHLAVPRGVLVAELALVLTGIFVIVCQLKINVTNAYAGSIAWSNFFSRLTHCHPGRVVWLVFNVVLALLLMEIGIFRAREHPRPLRQLRRRVDRRADRRPGHQQAARPQPEVHRVQARAPLRHQSRGGRRAAASAPSSLAFMGAFGTYADPVAFVALTVAFIAAPLIALGTHGKYYLPARRDQTGRKSPPSSSAHLRERVRAR